MRPCDGRSFESGKVLGRSQAFGAVAGRCSARAHAAAPAPTLSGRLDALHRHAMEVAAGFREAGHRPAYQSIFRSTLIPVGAELQRVSFEDAVA